MERQSLWEPVSGHVAEGRHVDWVPMETMSSAFAIVLATRSPRTQVRSSIWGAAHCRSTGANSVDFATCVSCRKARLPQKLFGFECSSQVPISTVHRSDGVGPVFVKSSLVLLRLVEKWDQATDLATPRRSIHSLVERNATRIQKVNGDVRVAVNNGFTFWVCRIGLLDRRASSDRFAILLRSVCEKSR